MSHFQAWMFSKLQSSLGTMSKSGALKTFSSCNLFFQLENRHCGKLLLLHKFSNIEDFYSTGKYGRNISSADEMGLPVSGQLWEHSHAPWFLGRDPEVALSGRQVGGHALVPCSKVRWFY